MDTSTLIAFIFKGLELAAPIAFLAIGAVYSERSGVINIGLEGMLIVSCFAVVWGALTFANIWMGLIVAIIAGTLMALIHAVVTITFRVNQIVSGVAINLLAMGVARFLSQNIYAQETQSEVNSYLFPSIFGINSFTLALIPIAFIAWFVMYKTVFGLRLRSVGENPEAADTLGINVYIMRYAGVLISGAMCGFGAATLYPAQWVSGMTGGRGFIALAAMIFGRWHPVGAVFAALLFGYADSFRIMFQEQLPIPGQFVQMFPYVLAVIVLAGMVGRAKPPAAGGIPYEKSSEL